MSNGLSQAEIDALLAGGGNADSSEQEPPQDSGGGMSQADIDALLAGGGDSAESSGQEPPQDSGGGMSQADIDALLAGGGGAADSGEAGEQEAAADGDAEMPENVDAFRDVNKEALDGAVGMLNDNPDIKGMYGTEAEFFGKNDEIVPVSEEALGPYELDAMGEIGNISMGTAATTLYALLNRKVNITTPKVTITTMSEIAGNYPQPFVAVEVSYTRGLHGNNILFLREKDVKIITDLLMGGDGTNIEMELGELHLSAISEVMNQMMGSSATSLSKMISMPIDISPPKAYLVNLAEQIPEGPLNASEPVVQNSFDMEVEGLIESEIMQVMPLEFSRILVKGLMDMQMNEMESAPAKEKPAAPAKAGGAPAPTPASAPSGETAAKPPVIKAAPPQEQKVVDVKPAILDAFDEEQGHGYENDNIDILMDVPLSVTVELGKSKKFIREILDFNVGSIVVLDKMAGELVDVIVNGKLIAKGEVVVIDDSYGARITDIISPSKRLNKN